jgi:hypothetical protein
MPTPSTTGVAGIAVAPSPSLTIHIARRSLQGAITWYSTPTAVRIAKAFTF